jgi:hypothetical protein
MFSPRAAVAALKLLCSVTGRLTFKRLISSCLIFAIQLTPSLTNPRPRGRTAPARLFPCGPRQEHRPCDRSGPRLEPGRLRQPPTHRLPYRRRRPHLQPTCPSRAERRGERHRTDGPMTGGEAAAGKRMLVDSHILILPVRLPVKREGRLDLPASSSMR